MYCNNNTRTVYDSFAWEHGSAEAVKQKIREEARILASGLPPSVCSRLTPDAGLASGRVTAPRVGSDGGVRKSNGASHARRRAHADELKRIYTHSRAKRGARRGPAAPLRQ